MFNEGFHEGQFPASVVLTPNPGVNDVENGKVHENNFLGVTIDHIMLETAY